MLTEILKSVASAGLSVGDAEWQELKAWVVRHNPKWAGRDPDSIPDGPVVKYLSEHIPEYRSCAVADRGAGPTTYFVSGLGKPSMNHEEFMAFLRSHYGD